MQLAPLRALRAARRLAADPDDLPQVFTIIEALSFDTLHRLGAGFQRTEEGRRLLREQPDIVSMLADREALRAYPEGTLARAYLAFVEQEGISAEGIREADARGEKLWRPAPAPLDWVQRRMRDTHDLWHAAVGYSGDVLGETALLAFSLAQTFNPSIALIVCIGLAKTATGDDGGRAARRTILDGFARGWRAAWLAGQPWEALLALPLAEVRRRLRLDDAPDYVQVRNSELRAAAP